MALTVPGAGQIVVLAQGAQLVSWRTADGLERLYLSPSAVFDGHTAVRGGVPVCFPQFGRRGPLPAHGFARQQPWRLAPPTAPDVLTWRLHDHAGTRALWPHAFDATLSIALEPDRVQMTLSVHNAGADPFDFTAALHSYLRVDDLATAHLAGWPESPALSIGIDRVFAHAHPTVDLVQPHHRLRVHQGGGFTDTVVWNPGGITLPDLPAADHARFVCIEAACVETPVRLMPADSWSGWQCLDAGRDAA